MARNIKNELEKMQDNTIKITETVTEVRVFTRSIPELEQQRNEIQNAKDVSERNFQAKMDILQSQIDALDKLIDDAKKMGIRDK